jgi:hypothetical protein
VIRSTTRLTLRIMGICLLGCNALLYSAVLPLGLIYLIPQIKGGIEMTVGGIFSGVLIVGYLIFSQGVASVFHFRRLIRTFPKTA